MSLPTPEEIAANQARLKAPWGSAYRAVGFERCQIDGQLLAADTIVYRNKVASAGGPLDMVNPNRSIEWNYRCARHAHQEENPNGA